MPLIREATREFEGFVAALDGAVRDAEAGRTAMSAARGRALDAAAARFAVRLAEVAPDVDALASLDAAHGLGLDPAPVLQGLAHERDAAIEGLTGLEDSQARAAALRDALLLKAQDGAQEAKAAARAARDAAEAVDGFDPAFLAVHAEMAPATGPAMQDGAVRGSGFLAELFDERLRAVRAAVAAYSDADGRDYFAVRDEVYLPLTRERDRLSGEASRRREEAIAARQDLIRREQTNLRGAQVVEAARTRLSRTEDALARPEVAVGEAAKGWFVRHVAAFEAQSALLDPKAADTLGGLCRAGLLDAADLAAIAHRLALGQAERGLADRRDALEGMLAELEPALEKLYVGLEGGVEGSYVEMDLPPVAATVREAVSGVEAALREAEALALPRAASEAARRAATTPIPAGTAALAAWMLDVATGGAIPEAAFATGSGLPPGLAVPEFDLPRPESPPGDYGEAEVPEIPAAL